MTKNPSLKTVVPVLFSLLSAETLSVSFAAGKSPDGMRVSIEKGEVEFRSTGHPSAIKIVGKSHALTGSFNVHEKQVVGSSEFDLTTLDTGIELRTRHMKEKYLETQKYPTAVLQMTRMTLPHSLSERSNMSGIPFRALLTLHGVTKEVNGQANILFHSSELEMDAQFSIRVVDFKIEQAKFAGITMADDVQVSVQGISLMPSTVTMKP